MSRLADHWPKTDRNRPELPEHPQSACTVGAPTVTSCPMRRSAGPALLCALLVCAAASPAAAADRPKPRPVYRDGPSGRYLLDGNWYSPRRSHRRGHTPRLQRQETSRRLGHDDRAERRRTPATSPTRATWAPCTGTARTSGCRRASAASKWVLPLRVRQLPREGVAERQADRLQRRRLPAVRAARARASGGAASTASSCGSTAAARRSTSRRCPSATRARSRAAGGTTTASCARSTCGKVDEPRLREVAVRPSLRRPHAAPPRSGSRSKVAQRDHPRPARAHQRPASAARACASSAHRVAGAAASSIFRARVRIRHPRLWRPEHPHLYTARLTAARRAAASSRRYTRPHRHPELARQPPRPHRS